MTVIATDADDRSRGPEAGERLLGLPRSNAPLRRSVPTTCSPSACSSAGRARPPLPDDLAIVGYDDIYFAGAAAVPLTSVRQPRHELGRRAAELVLDEAGNPDHAHEQVVLLPELVARTSTLG